MMGEGLPSGKVFYRAKFLAFEIQKFLSLIYFMKVLKNSLVGI